MEESLRQIQLIVDNSYDAIIGETLDGIITSWNGGATRMLGYTAEEAIGQSILSFVPPEQKEEVSAVFEKIKAGEVIADYDSVRLRKDGSIVHVAFSSAPLKAEDGTIIGVSCVERDITNRKWYVARIQRMSQLYAALSKCNKAVVYCVNENELFEQICGVAVQFGGMKMAWVGLLDTITKQVKPVFSFGTGVEYLDNIQISVNAEDPSGCGPTGTSIRENRPVWSQDFKNDSITAPWHEGAKKFGWRSSASLPLLRGGIPIGSLSLYSDTVNAFDDDAQKLLIEMARDISFALDNFADKKSLSLLKKAVDASHEAIYMTDREGVIIFVNHGFTALYGYRDIEVISKTTPRVLKSGLMKLEEYQAFWKEILAKQAVKVELTNKTRDGRLVAVEGSVNPILDEKEEITGFLAIQRDITERKKNRTAHQGVE